MWKQGPMPPDTWGWGGVVKKGMENQCGFYFADFHGDHVKICPGGEILQAEDVSLYNNCLTLPPNCTARAGEFGS